MVKHSGVNNPKTIRIKTAQFLRYCFYLICKAKQMAGFYMKDHNGVKWVKCVPKFSLKEGRELEHFAIQFYAISPLNSPRIQTWNTVIYIIDLTFE